MVKRYNRLLVAVHVLSDALLGMAAFLIAYALRFETGLIPVTKGHPPFQQYVNVLPFVGVLVPFASYNGHAWAADWPGPNASVVFPISLGDIPKRWWGAPGAEPAHLRRYLLTSRIFFLRTLKCQR